MLMTKKKTINRNYWKKEEEIIIKKWADKAQCYQWMHGKCRNIYKKKIHGILFQLLLYQLLLVQRILLKIDFQTI